METPLMKAARVDAREQLLAMEKDLGYAFSSLRASEAMTVLRTLANISNDAADAGEFVEPMLVVREALNQWCDQRDSEEAEQQTDVPF